MSKLECGVIFQGITAGNKIVFGFCHINILISVKGANIAHYYAKLNKFSIIKIHVKNSRMRVNVQNI